MTQKIVLTPLQSEIMRAVETLTEVAAREEDARTIPRPMEGAIKRLTLEFTRWVVGEEGATRIIQDVLAERDR